MDIKNKSIIFVLNWLEFFLFTEKSNFDHKINSIVY